MVCAESFSSSWCINWNHKNASLLLGKVSQFYEDVQIRVTSKHFFPEEDKYNSSIARQNNIFPLKHLDLFENLNIYPLASIDFYTDTKLTFTSQTVLYTQTQ